MDIDSALKEARLDIRMDTAHAPNEWYRFAELEAKQLCEGSGMELSFTFNCDRGLQAYAVYKSRLVVVTAGLFDFLCRLADRIVSKGIFPEIGKLADPVWNPDPSHAQQTARELIQDRPFDNNSPVWKENPDRKGLFFYLLFTSFRFVVLHEIGHFYHKHENRTKGATASLEVDSAQPRLLPHPDALDAQTRELVADKFAVDVLLRIVEGEVERIKKTALTAPLGQTLLSTKEKRRQFVLQIVYLYFSATDRIPGYDPTESVRMSHPPAAFRLVTIAASLTENLDNEHVRKNVLATTILSDAVISVALNREPDPDWLAHMQDPIFSDHYKQLYERVGAWTRNETLVDTTIPIIP